jgi:lauroyl/myristoyl acyltransferase
LPRLPRKTAHSVADVISSTAWLLHPEGRKLTLSNVTAVFGNEMPSAEKQQLVRQSYGHFGRALADLYWSPRVTPENLGELIDLQELETLPRDGAKIFACFHYGSFEWIALALSLSGFPSTVVTQVFKNPLLNPIIERMRAVGGYQIVRREGAMLRLFRALRSGRNVVLAVDLTISPRLPSVPITCFGMHTCVTFAHGWLHKRTGAPIIPTHMQPLPDGRNRLVLHPPLMLASNASDREIAQACWDSFEPVVRQNPAPWLWMYKHWRYLPPNPQRPYPEYANESPHFHKLLARSAAG